jgi:Family of unknown function (DUF6463)
MLVAALHLGFAAMAFPRQLQTIARDGWWGGVERDAMLGAVTWFVLFALPLFLAGFAIHAMERQACQLPKALAWGLLATGALGIALMPASGFYLVLPAAVAILVRAKPSKEMP